ncbi:MAG: LemA family protein [Oligosphaeraceae bacterium]
MANELDEMTGPVNEEGRDIHVIEKQIPVKVGAGSLLFEILLWVCGIIPGLIFQLMKVSAKNYFQKLQQKIQAHASEIDNYLEQRVMILQNLAALVNKAVTLDKEVMLGVAAYRSGVNPAGGGMSDAQRNELARGLEHSFGRLFPQVEAYPELKAHKAIADAIQQNSYLQREITAARSLYNDTVAQWNTSLFEWPTRQIVAAREGYTTRIPFTASAEIRNQARQNFF